MDRRYFLGLAGLSPWTLFAAASRSEKATRERAANVVIVGGGCGGCAGARVILTEETDWLGGQLTAQAVPPDEHPWIEAFGATRLYSSFRRVENLLPACKNLGVTHITNGCYCLHPVEWNIGEAAVALAAFCLERKEPPRQVRKSKKLLEDFQKRLQAGGVELHWPRLTPR
jgi:hypothetical protein